MGFAEYDRQRYETTGNGMEFWHYAVAAAVATAILEGITCWFRFGRGMVAREDLTWMARWTRGFRLHHGYPGIPLLGLSYVDLPMYEPLALGLFALGSGLFFSDAIHHFVVLPLTVGRTEFDLKFPTPGEEPEPEPALALVGGGSVSYREALAQEFDGETN